MLCVKDGPVAVILIFLNLPPNIVTLIWLHDI